MSSTAGSHRSMSRTLSSNVAENPGVIVQTRFAANL